MIQDRLVDVLVRKIQETVLTPHNLERLRDALRAQIDQRRTASSGTAGALRKQLADLDRDIDRAADNFVRAPAEVLDLIGKKLTALKRQRDHLQEELRRAVSTDRPKDAQSEVDAVVARLWRLGEDMAKADAARRREVFRLLVSRIDLRFGQVQRGKRTECPLLSGEIHLRTGEGTILGSVSRGDRI